MKRTLMMIIASALIGGCGAKVQQDETLIRPKTETVINYTDGIEDKEIIEFVYEKPDDRFWIKAVYKDTTGKQLRICQRELDAVTRLPIKEYIIDELGEIDEYNVLAYDADSKLLTKKQVYNKEIAPKNLTSELTYKYQNGVLISSTITTYSLEPDYRNADGNNITQYIEFKYLPNAESRGRGNVETFYRIANRKMYCTKEFIERFELKNSTPGDIYLTEETKFDTKGYPESYTSTDPTAGDEHRFSKEFYTVKVDDKGRITELTPYANEKRDSVAKDALMWKFIYNSDGKIAKVDEIMLNEANHKYELQHGREQFTWFDIAAKQPELADASVTSEHFCQHRKVYSKNQVNIEKFTKAEKITVTKVASMDGGFPTQELPGIVTRKSIMQFEEIKKK